MNKILHLFDEQYVLDLFKKKLLPKYPSFRAIKKIKIIPIKKNIWDYTYHVVIKFETKFITKDNKIKQLPIYCSAHSDEPRKNVYSGLKFLWGNSFNKGYLSIPHPLFYSNYFKATFYRGVAGKNLYKFIREKNFKEIETILPKAAAWFYKLHGLPVAEAKNFNQANSRIKTVIPGKEYILKKIENNYPEFYNFYCQAYDIFIKREESFLADKKNRWLIHGDAHPENVIKMSKHKLAVIDFTDLCLADYARDLGCFLQQLEYMANRKINNPKYTKKIKKIFLENYLENAKIKLDDNLKERINNYYNWTAVRTTTFFLFQKPTQPEMARELIDQIKKNLNIN